jgi:hypothetical protein
MTTVTTGFAQQQHAGRNVGKGSKSRHGPYRASVTTALGAVATRSIVSVLGVVSMASASQRAARPVRAVVPAGLGPKVPREGATWP